MLKRLGIVAFALFLLGCNAPSSAPAPAAPVTPAPFVTPAAPPFLPLDSKSWREEFIKFPGLNVPEQPNPTTPGCPKDQLCFPVPDAGTGDFLGYVMHPILAIYSHTTADATPHYEDISGYHFLVLKLTIIAPKDAQFLYHSEEKNDAAHGCVTPPHIRPFLGHTQEQLEFWAWRWFAHDPKATKSTDNDTMACLLQPGDCTLTVPLQQADWVSANPGGPDPNAEAKGWSTMIKDVSNFGLGIGGGCADAHGANCKNGPCEIRVVSYGFK